MTLALHHIALKVSDLQRCERFYAEVLGLSVTARHNDDSGKPRSIWLDCDGTILMLERSDAKSAKEEKSPGWHLLALKISSEERENWKKRLAKAGVEIARESPYSLYFSDPEGNRLALSHYRAE